MFPNSAPEKHAVTFAVSDVEKADLRLKQNTYRDVIEEWLSSSVEACSMRTAALVYSDIHPLVGAIHHAFAGHRPLALSPDHIWLLLCQGLAEHIKANAERLRPLLVSHSDKKNLSVQRDDFVKGDALNPWPEVFSAFSKQIRDHAPAVYDKIITTFSTTSAVEKAAMEITLMDAMRPYFDLFTMTLCGIPEITLEGTPDDWMAIVDRFQSFRDYELGWWVDSLTPVLKQFVQAARGSADRDFWCSMYKRNDQSGGPYITGWIIRFFPYEMTFDGTARNPFVERDPQNIWEGLRASHVPLGISKAPFEWQYYLQTFNMEFVAGFVGIQQDDITLTLRPEIGWAVRDAAAKR
jgi:hypothetical protein